MDNSEDFPEGVQRKDLRLPPLQTSFDNEANKQFHRPRPPVNVFGSQSGGNASHGGDGPVRDRQLSMLPDSKTNSLRKRSSLFGLGGLFNRSKPAEVDGKQEKLDVQWEADELSEKVDTKPADNACLPEPSVFPEELDALPEIDTEGVTLRHKASKSALKSKASFKREGQSKPPTTWDPPPLFQVYPQALKHANLRVPNLTAEAILRLNSAKHNTAGAIVDSYTPDTYTQKAQKERKLKRSTAADVLSKIDWVPKIFVLVTSGYLLQYAGEGAYDRLPEKIMPLTTESAAFASDVVPGHPYVLQISQVLDEKGTLDKEISKSMLKKLGLRNEMRRSTSTFLLVLESPEEMSAWLVAVRKEIQAMGGKEYKSDEFKKVTVEEEKPRLQERPSQRYLVKRDPNRFGDMLPQSTPPAVTFANRPKTEGQASNLIEPSVSAGVSRQSLSTQYSVGSRTVSTAAASINQVYLDDLRESPRESYASTGAKTVSTSPGSSPRLSPQKIKADVSQLSHGSVDEGPYFSTPAEAKHFSVQPPSNEYARRPNILHPDSAISGPQSTDVHVPQQRRTSSPPAPNFSVPSFSKRYSTAFSPATSSSSTPKPQTPPIVLQHQGLSPPVDGGALGELGQRTSTISELQHLRKPIPKTSRRNLQRETDAFLTPPHSSGSADGRSSINSEQRFSRRLSSLEYAKGHSPVNLRQSPSPHPPPTAALPPIPGEQVTHHASAIPPPTIALPSTPSTHDLPQRSSMLPVPAKTESPLPAARSSSNHSNMPSSSTAILAGQGRDRSSNITSSPSSKDGALASPANESISGVSSSHKSSKWTAMNGFVEPQKLSLPEKSQMRKDPNLVTPPQPFPRMDYMTAFDEEGLTPPLEDSPPKPTRAPPPPPTPPQKGRVQGRKTSPRVGREPPPVYSPANSPRSRISVSSPAESYFDGAAPHPFIPPIRVSERKFRGSFDGPWNPGYGAPQRTFLDLSVN